MEKKRIQIEVNLDEKKMPQSIHWQGEGGLDVREAKAFLLSLWDKQASDTYKIDLWTGTMQKEEMIHFFSHTLASMSDTLTKSVGCKKAAEKLLKVSKDFYKETIEELRQSDSLE